MLQDNPATVDSVGIRSGFSSGRTPLMIADHVLDSPGA